MYTAKIKPKRWWWPPDRKKAKIMQLVMNYITDKPEVQDKINKGIQDYMIYGKVPKL